MKDCNVSGCAGVHLARGYCARHYRQLIRGTAPVGDRPVRPPARRNRVVMIRLSDEERRRFDEVARASGLTPGVFLRDVVIYRLISAQP